MTIEKAWAEVEKCSYALPTKGANYVQAAARDAMLAVLDEANRDEMLRASAGDGTGPTITALRTRIQELGGA